ncbi:unnamed protein product [Psylliodes chrysocephalus]|uniref:HAT C-terminal dimerisation domain-containing protein n=1 Tax=Psylliodes chrysocephalus TaxID=3402493 RepID=A0A9P0CL06_9CUCU|nr:unnamed protein product [Psylliodes chrysocephala]
MNKISGLKNSFSAFSLEEKLQIKELGRPILDLKIEKQSGSDKTWSKKGTDDLVHIWDKIKSQVHMNNVLACPCLLALRGHDEKDNSENRGIFKELVNFSAELDNDLKVHIQNSKAFKGTTKTIQNELLECVLDVYHEEVRKEIENSSFVAVIAVETTEVAFKYLIMPQVVIIFNQLQKVCTDFVKVKKDLENFEEAIQGIREQMNSIIDNIQGEINTSKRETGEPIRKKARIEENSKKREALEICDAETLKLLGILITIPMSTSEAERCF